MERSSEEKERSPCLAPVDGGGGGGGGRRVLAVDALMVVWGLGAWLGVNALYVQLPLLVERAPERWALPASMALAVQAANAGPLLYGAWARRWPLRHAADARLILALLALGALALLLNAGLHPLTVALGGRALSLPFLALTWATALVGCTSSVLFYPHLRHFRDIYLATFLAGEGLAGLLPGLAALVQGVGGEPTCSGGVPAYPPPRFGSGAFLAGAGALVACSGAAFALLERLPLEGQRVAAGAAAKGAEAAPRVRLRAPRWAALLALAAALGALLNGALPALQSFACLPYGARAYHLAAALGAAAAPAAGLAGVWLRPVGARALAALLLAALGPLALVLAMALAGRPLLAGAAGAALAVAAWVAAAALLSYARVWACGRARAGGARAMRALGAATQAGSAAGSALLFLLVNHTQLFVQPAPCAAADANATVSVT